MNVQGRRWEYLVGVKSPRGAKEWAGFRKHHSHPFLRWESTV